MEPYIYLTLDDILELHLEISERTSAKPGLLRGDGEGLIESALATAKWAAYYEGADLAAQATKTAVAISQNQPFEDGNKRAACASVVMFLQINGFDISIDPLDLAQHLNWIAEADRRNRQLCIDLLTQVIRESLVPLGDDEQGN